MSISYRTYVGPYVRCAVGTKAVQMARYVCTNAACINHRGSYARLSVAFCPRCGSRYGDVTYTGMVDTVNAWDVIEAIDEHLMNASGDAYLTWVEEERAHIYVPNIGGTAERQYHLNTRENFALIEIMPDQMPQEIARFAADFAAEIATVREWYGADAVTLHWGILQDYN